MVLIPTPSTLFRMDSPLTAYHTVLRCNKSSQVFGGPQAVGFRQQGRQQDLHHQQDTKEARFGQFSFADRAQADTHSPTRPMTMLPPTPRPAAGSGSVAAPVAPAVLASPSAAGMMRQHPRPMLSPHTSQATRYMQMPNSMMTPNGSAALGFMPPVIDPRTASISWCSAAFFSSRFRLYLFVLLDLNPPMVNPS